MSLSSVLNKGIVFNHWKDALLSLLKRNEYDEVIQLAFYYPSSYELRLLLFLAYTLKEDCASCENELDEINKFKDKDPYFDLLSLSKELTDFTNITKKSIENNKINLTLFLINLLKLREEDSDLICNLYLYFAKKLFQLDRLDLGETILDTIIKNDDSPSYLLDCAEIAFSNRKDSNYVQLSNLGLIYLNQARNKVQSDDINFQIKILKLLIISKETIRDAFHLIDRLISNNLLKRTEDILPLILLPLIEEKSYYKIIVKKLITLSIINLFDTALALILRFEEKNEPNCLLLINKILDNDIVFQEKYLDKAFEILTFSNKIKNEKLLEYISRLNLPINQAQVLCKWIIASNNDIIILDKILNSLSSSKILKSELRDLYILAIEYSKKINSVIFIKKYLSNLANSYDDWRAF